MSEASSSRVLHCDAKNSLIVVLIALLAWCSLRGQHAPSYSATLEALPAPKESGDAVDLAAASFAGQSTEQRGEVRRAIHAAQTAVAAKFGIKMGNTGESALQTEGLADLVERYSPGSGTGATTLCEVGVNVGHSAATLVTASGASEYIGFDYGAPTPAHVRAGLDQLAKALPHLRVTLELGDSTATLPAFFASNSSVVCDVWHIDGGHDGLFPEKDFQNARSFARPDGQTLVIFDDCGSSTEWGVMPFLTYKRGIRQHTITEIDGIDALEVGNRRSCVARMMPGEGWVEGSLVLEWSPQKGWYESDQPPDALSDAGAAALSPRV